MKVGGIKNMLHGANIFNSVRIIFPTSCYPVDNQWDFVIGMVYSADLDFVGSGDSDAAGVDPVRLPSFGLNRADSVLFSVIKIQTSTASISSSRFFGRHFFRAA
jgi:hypothetical protein